MSATASTGPDEGAAATAGVRLRTSRRGDGPRMLALVRQGGALEENSTYAYLLLATHFAGTCVVADADERLAGFVAGYLPPDRPATVFVWQIGVAPFARRQGLGRRMLLRLLETPACRDVRFLETTVTPSNEASRKLFASFARTLGASLVEEEGFSARDFEPELHEAERLLRIGPLETKHGDL